MELWNTRRRILGGGALALAGAALAACGGVAATTGTGTTGSTGSAGSTGNAGSAAGAKASDVNAAPPTTAKVTGPVELMWSNEQTTIDFINNDWFPNFKKENPQVETTLTVVPGSWDDLFQKIQVTSAAGTAPALTRGKDYFTGDMAAMGLVQPLDSYLKGQKEITADQYLPAIWGNVNYKGTVIGIPLYSFVRPLYYNVALFQEAGLMKGDQPIVAETWDDWARMARQLTQPSKGIWGTQLYNYAGEDGTTTWINYLIQNGGEYINGDRTKYTFNSPAGIETLNYLVDLVLKDRACRGPHDDNPDGVRKIGMWNAVGDGNYNNYPTKMPDFKYAMSMVPKQKNRGVVARGQGLYMMKSGPNHDGAWAFMRFASRDENSHNFTQAIHLGPVKTANFSKEPYVSNPEWKVIMDQYRVKENLYQPIYGGYTDGAKAVAEELMAAYTGQKTPKDALADAERRATQFLKS